MEGFAVNCAGGAAVAAAVAGHGAGFGRARAWWIVSSERRSGMVCMVEECRDVEVCEEA